MYKLEVIILKKKNLRFSEIKIEVVLKNKRERWCKKILLFRS